MKSTRKWDNFAKDMIHDIAGSVLQAIGVWFFIEPSHIAPGGVSGMALILNHLFGLPVGAISFIINIPLLIASYLYLDRKMTWKTIRTVIWMSVIMDGLAALGLPQYTGDRLISCAFGGIFVGAGMAVIFMRNSTTGGGDILAKLLQKFRPYLQTGTALLIIDAFVVGASVLAFGEIEAAMYGVISLVCTTQTIDTIIYGMNKGSMITIHSGKNHEIAEEIMRTMDRGTTFYKSVGGYSGKECETLTCAVDRKQFYMVKEIIDKYDPKAFVIVSPTKEVYGEGFLNDPRTES
ncbi:MAG: YitT family protein [Lachnospiraceae bacterium]|nr:YitT family protein [Lachnospiraceae bacterium]